MSQGSVVQPSVVPGSVWTPSGGPPVSERGYRYTIITGEVSRGGLVLADLRRSPRADPERVYVRHEDLGRRLRRVDV
jgi:hypothetical protein